MHVLWNVWLRRLHSKSKRKLHCHFLQKKKTMLRSVEKIPRRSTERSFALIKFRSIIRSSMLKYGLNTQSFSGSSSQIPNLWNWFLRKKDRRSSSISGWKLKAVIGFYLTLKTLLRSLSKKCGTIPTRRIISLLLIVQRVCSNHYSLLKMMDLRLVSIKSLRYRRQWNLTTWCHCFQWTVI